MKLLHRILLVSAVLAAAVAVSRAKETPHSLAEKLQAEFLSAPAVSFNFDLGSEGHVRVLADIRGGRIRMESPTLLIISDGRTVWNYDNVADRVTIDNVTERSEFHDPTSLFRFADNYSASIVRASGNRYTLVLTPLKALQALLHNAGGMQSIRMDVIVVEGGHVKIVNAAATSTRGTQAVQHLEIKLLPSVNAADFTFTPKASTKVVDLRE